MKRKNKIIGFITLYLAFFITLVSAVIVAATLVIRSLV